MPTALDPHDTAVLLIFGVVYLGMILGGLPRLHLDRTGVALLGAIAVVGSGLASVEQAARAVHLPTLLMLFAFMVISAQMRLGGFYAAVTRVLVRSRLSPAVLLGAVIGVAALLSAVFTNDIVCLAMAPLLAEACRQRRLDPVPYLLGLACASNIGSAATLIGNPQNILIGEVLRLPFAAYTAFAAVPVLLGCAVLWAWLAWRGGLSREAMPAMEARARVEGKREGEGEGEAEHDGAGRAAAPAFDRWQSTKGLAVVAALLVIFLFTSWPRDVAALVGAGLLLLSQRFHSSKVMGLVDWELLILFIGLFVVNEAMQASGATAQALQGLRAQGLDLQQPGFLFVAVVGLSNLVSNVPAVMLLLPAVQDGAHGLQAGATLALASTLAGNLLIVGSIANLIVVDAARRAGVVIDWRTHARSGVPVTLLTLAIAAAWLAVAPAALRAAG